MGNKKFHSEYFSFLLPLSLILSLSLPNPDVSSLAPFTKASCLRISVSAIGKAFVGGPE